MTKCLHTSPTNDLHFCLGDLSDALISARQNLHESRYYNRQKLVEGERVVELLKVMIMYFINNGNFNVCPKTIWL